MLYGDWKLFDTSGRSQMWEKTVYIGFDYFMPV